MSMLWNVFNGGPLKEHTWILMAEDHLIYSLKIITMGTHLHFR